MLPKLEFYYNNKSDVLDVVLHGSRSGMGSNFIQRIYEAGKQTGRSVLIFDFPYIDRSEEKLMDQPREEEKESLKSVLEKFGGNGYKKIRLIGKSLGAVVAAEYLVSLPEEEQKKFELIVLGYDLGWIDLDNFVGEVTVIQGSEDPFGDIDDIRRDLKGNKAKKVTLRGIGGADHSFMDPQTGMAKYLGKVLKLLFINYKVEKEEPDGASTRWLEIEPVIQKFDYDCGGAMFSSLMLLIDREDVLKTDVYKRLKVGPEGTKPTNIKRVLREEKIEFVETFGATMEDLKRMIKNGYVCAVAYQAWGTEEEYAQLEGGHYSVVFDATDKYIWLIDPSIHEEILRGFGAGIGRKETSEFDKRWKDKDADGELYDHWMLAVKT